MATYLETLTPNDFKNYFNLRDFEYAVIWLNTSTYQIGDIVYYTNTRLFYKCLKADITTVPTTAEDWAVLTSKLYVLDEDINRAFEKALPLTPESSFTKQTTAKMVYFLITAHFISIDLSSQGGVSGIDAPGFITSKSVGDLSVSYSSKSNLGWLEEFLATTKYGKEALIYIKSITAATSNFLSFGKTTNA